MIIVTPFEVQRIIPINMHISYCKSEDGIICKRARWTKKRELLALHVVDFVNRSNPHHYVRKVYGRFYSPRRLPRPWTWCILHSSEYSSNISSASSLISSLNSSGSNTSALPPCDNTHLFTSHQPEVFISRMIEPSGWSIILWSLAQVRSLMYRAWSSGNQILVSNSSS